MYCKSNVRRVINYTQTEPINKYDLWLSENARYNEDGELEYDNDGQPACDLILKLFRHGRWEPVVGYNTTTINNVSEQEWLALFNSSPFYNAWNSPDNTLLELWLATTERIGGIKADTWSPIVSNKYEGIECLFPPNGYIGTLGHEERLFINAWDVNDAINNISLELYNEDPASELLVNGHNGIDAHPIDGHNGIWVSFSGVNIDHAGMLPIVNSTGNGFDYSYGPNINSNDIDVDLKNVVIDGNTCIIGSDEITLNEWNCYNITNFKNSVSFSSLPNSNNPIYLKISFSNDQLYPIVTSDSSINVIDVNGCLSGDTLAASGTYLFTMQFNTLKIEKQTIISR